MYSCLFVLSQAIAQAGSELRTTLRSRFCSQPVTVYEVKAKPLVSTFLAPLRCDYLKFICSPRSKLISSRFRCFSQARGCRRFRLCKARRSVGFRACFPADAALGICSLLSALPGEQVNARAESRLQASLLMIFPITPCFRFSLQMHERAFRSEQRLLLTARPP